MRQPRILCVPNFSEGRHLGTINALARAVRRVPGVTLLDQHTDPDHHRTVLTFAGPPARVAEAAYEATKVASRLIDLRRHRGEHPRIGATDVIPLVPLDQASTRHCVTLARALARRIGRELKIPVFLYEQAASRPERRRLEVVRQGGLDGLSRRMAEDPAWRPDFGPHRLHPSAGATVVGARPPLIAFNVNLASRDLGAAREIAERVRASGGGLPGVKALGIELGSRGLVQVSTNVTDFRESPLHRVFLAVKEEAAKKGITVESSELVGLIPVEALAHVAEHQLQLERFSLDRIVEVRMARLAPPSRRQADAGSAAGRAPAVSVDAFLSAVARAKPTPGSGSVAALVAASAAALGVKACAVTIPTAVNRKGPARGLGARLKRLQALRVRLERLIRADARAYEEVLASRKVPGEHAKQNRKRERRLARAWRRAVEVPLNIAGAALRTAEELRGVVSGAKASVAPDARVGRDLAVAACRSALKITEENLKSIKKQTVADGLREKIRRLRELLVVAGGL